MVQVLEPKESIFGRVGGGIGKGLAEQIPKEVDRYRLSQGLQQFEKDSGNLSPMQQLTRLAGIPGALDHPQLIQSFGELARQNAKSQAFSNSNKTPKDTKKEPEPFPYKRKPNPKGQGAGVPSLTTEKPIEETLKPYIPITYEQKIDRAQELYEESPALYDNNPQKAIEAVDQEEAQKKAISEAYQGQRVNENAVQDNIVNRLQKHSSDLQVAVPPDVYSKIEDKAIEAVKPKSQGGRGLTEQQAMKEYGKELDEISREYAALDTLGNFTLPFNSTTENLRVIKGMQKNFKKRDDQRNFADKLIGEHGISPSKAYLLAYPVSDYKGVNNFIVKLPDINPVARSHYLPQKEVPDSKEATLSIAPKMMELMIKENASPLAIGEELSAKGYDMDTWLQYLIERKDKLDSKRMSDELDKPRSNIPNLNDWWLFGQAGMKRFLENPVLPPLEEIK